MEIEAITEKDIKDKNMKEFKHVHEGLWTFVLPSYFTDGENPRIDCYQNTKENRIIMMALLDIHLRLKNIEKFIKNKQKKVKNDKRKN